MDELKEQRKEALILIDMAAGQARLRYITEVAGQQAVYQVKLAEAKLWQADPQSVPGPHLSMEAQELGIPVSELVSQVLAEGQLWLNDVSPRIEAYRRAGKVKVGLAETVVEIDQQVALTLAALAAV